MTLTLELTPVEEARLQANALQAGKPVIEFVQELIGNLPEPPLSEYDATLALFKQWEAEVAQMTPEQMAAEDEGWDEIMENLRVNRVSFPVPDLSGHD